METDDPDKIIELAESVDTSSKTNRANGRKDKASMEDRKELFRQIGREAMREVALEGLTEEEQVFGDAIIAGASMAAAFAEAYPAEAEGLSYTRLYQLATRVSKRPTVRSHIATRLDEEEGDISHTSARLNNFIIKSLEHEAKTARTDGARLKALELLSKHKAVQVTEDLTGAKAKAERSTEEVLEEIRKRIDKLTG